MGYSRVGCILCPLARKSERKRDELNFPKFKENYIKAFERMLRARKERGKETTFSLWTDGEAVYKWWMEDRTDPNQITLDNWLYEINADYVFIPE